MGELAAPSMVTVTIPGHVSLRSHPVCEFSYCWSCTTCTHSDQTGPCPIATSAGKDTVNAKKPPATTRMGAHAVFPKKGDLVRACAFVHCHLVVTWPCALHFSDFIDKPNSLLISSRKRPDPKDGIGAEDRHHVEFAWLLRGFGAIVGNNES
jgi:hypothetical protein